MQKLIKTVHKFFSAGEKGFTLVELLVVVAILGTLAGVVALNVTNFLGAGESEACNTEVDIVQAAVVAYMAGNDSAVPTLAQLVAADYLMTLPSQVVEADIAATGAVANNCP